MLTQSELNFLLERAKIITFMHGINKRTLLLVDLEKFFYELRIAEKVNAIPVPIEMDMGNDGSLFIEWFEVRNNKDHDFLRIEFHGDQKIKLIAEYTELEIEIEQRLDFNEDFADLVFTHLRKFKRKIKKKRYK